MSKRLTFVRPVSQSLMTGNLYPGQSWKDRGESWQGKTEKRTRGREWIKVIGSMRKNKQQQSCIQKAQRCRQKDTVVSIESSEEKTCSIPENDGKWWVFKSDHNTERMKIFFFRQTRKLHLWSSVKLLDGSNRLLCCSFIVFSHSC